MRVLQLLFMFMITGFLWADPVVDYSLSADQASLEAKAFGEEGLLKFQKLFDKGLGRDDCLLDPDDLLSSADKGKRLDPEVADIRSKSADIGTSLFERELAGFVKEVDELENKRDKNKDFEGTEALFASSHVILENPNQSTGVLLQPAEYVADLDNLETCLEPGVYQAFVKLNLKVQRVSEKKEGKTWVCQGHHIEETFDSSRRADDFRKRRLNEYQSNPNIEPSTIHTEVVKHGWRNQLRDVNIIYAHKKGFKCAAALHTNSEIEEFRELDIWEPEDQDFYNNLKSNSNCKLIYENVVDFADTREIEGKPVHREAWGKKLCFNCGFTESLDCKKLRDAKGVLQGKLCLNENAHGQCEMWKKTYDMGGVKYAAQSKVLENTEGMWGLGDQFDASYEKNRDFGEVIATFSSISDMKGDLADNPVDIDLDMRVFAGKAFQCKKNHFNNAFYDCCGELDGGLIKLNIVDCNSDEKLLQKSRQEGKTVWIDKKKTFSIDGWSETNCYCVFPTKLARVVQEHARKKFPSVYPYNKPWGDLKKPDCSGITLEQLTSLNFEEIDLSEVVKDIRQEVSQKQLAKRLNQVAREISGDELLKKAEDSTGRMIDFQTQQTRRASVGN